MQKGSGYFWRGWWAKMSGKWNPLEQEGAVGRKLWSSCLRNLIWKTVGPHDPQRRHLSLGRWLRLKSRHRIGVEQRESSDTMKDKRGRKRNWRWCCRSPAWWELGAGSGPPLCWMGRPGLASQLGPSDATPDTHLCRWREQARRPPEHTRRPIENNFGSPLCFLFLLLLNCFII